MKKLIFLIACVTYSITSAGQEIALSNTVNITQPKGMVKLSNDEVSSFAKERFKNKKASIMAVDGNPKHAYRVNNILITLHSETGVIEAGHLLKLKNGLDEMFGKNKTYSSNIETINGNKVLITLRQGEEDVKYYQFFSFNKANTSAISGTLQFNTSEENKAKSVLNDILKGLKFKE